MKEVKELVVGTVKNVIEKLAEEQQIDKKNLKIRIDLEKNINSKPVFGMFNASNFVGKKSLKEVIKAGGGQGFNMIIGTYIKKIIWGIFTQTMIQLKTKETKDVFILLYLQEIGQDITPILAVYHRKEFIWAMRISEAIEAAPQIK